ncbi:hypothetical protein L484_007853 [Morus notabilis]|uniref:Uncharacterized protein n=1 Tax=Morus notabilis TaxID=981085 RepID=W9RJP1_9ROSA|nr:hypothetical protein L484_007853 [Morus notabilis]
MLQGLSASVTPVHSMSPFDSSKSRIMDLELDVNDDAGDVDILAVCGKRSSGISSSVEKWKFNMISLISGFFSVLHVVTWDILFELMDKECNSKVRERILYNLCQHPYWSPSSNFTDLSLMHLRDLINQTAELDHLEWSGHVKLVDCICDFVLLSPQIGQVIFNEDYKCLYL